MQRLIHWLLGIAVCYAMWIYVLKPTPNLEHVLKNSHIGEYQITELASYQGEFRILGRQDYRFDREAEFSPVDFAVGWGVMADPQNYSQIEISQDHRWYYWRVSPQSTIPLRQIETHSANMHIIPANALVARQLKRISRGDKVYLKGALVDIKSSDGWRWTSSLSRTDTGAGACELMRVDQVYVISKVS